MFEYALEELRLIRSGTRLADRVRLATMSGRLHLAARDIALPGSARELESSFAPIALLNAWALGRKDGRCERSDRDEPTQDEPCASSEHIEAAAGHSSDRARVRRPFWRPRLR